jgi:hypothetical protein
MKLMKIIQNKKIMMKIMILLFAGRAAGLELCNDAAVVANRSGCEPRL